MSSSLTGLARAFKSPPAPVSETPALVRPETWQDPGLLTIGPKSYGYRSSPGNPDAGCARIVRLFQGDGFADETYDVSFHTLHGPLCTCADFTYRDKEATGETCKHVRAVAALELDRSPIAVHVDPAGVPDVLDSDLELAEDPDAPF
jgi:hypothetical protein